MAEIDITEQEGIPEPVFPIAEASSDDLEERGAEAARLRFWSGWFESATNWADTMWTVLFNKLNKALKALGAVSLEQFSENAINKLADDLQTAGFPTRITIKIRGISMLPFPIDIIAAVVVSVLLPIRFFWSWLGAAANHWAQDANQDIRPNLVDLSTLGAMWWRVPEDRTKILDLYNKWGLPNDQIAMQIAATVGLPSLQEILVLVNREEFSPELGKSLLEAQGIPPTYADSMLELRKYYPSATELVSLAGREAFEPESIARFKLDMDFDLLDMKVFEKGGVTPEVARWYWIAHWNNPSLTQVFEMIHRKVIMPGAKGEPGQGGVFGLDDLAVYYKLADINPFFGDMLRQIAFRVPGRVDIRRFLRDGVIERDDAKKMYEALGYAEPNAELMTQFAENEKNKSTRGITRTQIINLYRLGEIDRIQLAGWLEAIGYDKADSTAISWLEFSKLEEKRLVSFIRRAEYEYKRDIVDRVEAQKFLGDENITAERIAGMLEEWDNEKVVEAAVPSKDDWINWRESGQIEPEEFKNGMERLRYSDEDINKYIESMGAVLSKTDLLRLFDRDQIDDIRAASGLEKLGYSLEDRTALINEVKLRKERRAEFESTQGSGG